MNYIYIISYEYTVTTYFTERYKHLHEHALFFLNLYLENSIFHPLRNILFSKIVLYPPLYCAYCVFIYNIV